MKYNDYTIDGHVNPKTNLFWKNGNRVPPTSAMVTPLGF